MTDVRNMTEKQARIELETRLGLVVKIEYETSSEVLKDYVVRTSPAENSEVAEGDTITVYLSKGTDVKKVNMTKLIGMSLDDAKREIERLGLVVGTVGESESSRDKGVVLSQSIAEGTEVEEKTTVNLTVSAGKKQEEAKPEPSKTPEPSGGETTENTPAKPEPSTNPGNSGGETTQPDENTKSKTITVKLPASPESFTLSAKVNDKQVYSKTHQASEGSANITLRGTGTVTVSIYIDGKLFHEISVSFD